MGQTCTDPSFYKYTAADKDQVVTGQPTIPACKFIEGCKRLTYGPTQDGCNPK